MKMPAREFFEQIPDDESFESPAWHADALAEAEAQYKSGKAHFVDLETAKKQLARL